MIKWVIGGVYLGPQAHISLCWRSGSGALSWNRYQMQQVP